MRAFLSRFTIMVLVFLLGMPMGWCCVPGGNQSANALDGVQSCCRHTLPQSPSDERPLTPDPECCCVQDVVVSHTAAKIVDSSTETVDYNHTLDDFRPEFSSHILVERLALQTEPRTHLLQCVWLC